MRQLAPWAGAAALALATFAYAACAGAPAQDAGPTPGPARTAALGETELPQSQSGPPRVEAGAGVGAPTAESPKPEAKVVYVGPRDVKAVALTFDTGVQAGQVPEVLDLLKERGKRASFGVTGQWAVTNPDLLKRIVDEGHAVLNHSWSHPSFTGEDTETEPLTADQMRDELNRTEEKVQEIAGVSTKPYFRPPYGDYDRLVNLVVREEGYEYNVLWLIDSMGWDGRSAKSIVGVTLANAINGAIFLFHTDNSRDAAALEAIIDGLDERGFVMATIPQLLGKEPIPTPAATPTPEPTEAPPPPKPRPTLTATKPAPTPTSTPAPAYTVLASDDFESAGPDGGEGWLGAWQSSYLFALSDQAPHSGGYQLDMSNPGLVQRSLDLAGRQNVHLRFWSRLSGVTAIGQAAVAVSSDGGWQVVKEFTAVDASGAYRLYDLDLSGLQMSGSFAIAFYSQLNPATQHWYIDDVQLGAFAP